MTILTIHNDIKEIVRVRLPDIDPIKALPAILAALDNLPKPRKPRSDKGKPGMSDSAMIERNTI